MIIPPWVRFFRSFIQHLVQRLKFYSVYRRIVLSYILVVVITVSIVSVGLFATFRNKAVLDMAENARLIVVQTAFTAETIYEQILTIGTALLSNREVSTALYSNEVNRYQEFKTNLFLTSLGNTYPFISFIAVYNDNTDRLINPTGATAESERSMIDTIKKSSRGHFVEMFLRDVVLPWEAVGISHKVITFVLQPDYFRGGQEKSFIMLNVGIDDISNLLFNNMDDTISASLVFDGKGDIIASSSSLAAGQDILSLDCVRTILRGKSLDPVTISVIGKRRYLVSHAMSSLLGWHFLDFKLYDSIIANIWGLTRISLLAALLLLIAVAGASMVVMNNIYNPLAVLVAKANSANMLQIAENEVSLNTLNEFEVLSKAYDRFVMRIGLLEDTIHGDLPILRRAYAYSLILGAPLDLPLQENAELRNRIEREFEASNYTVALVVVDRLENNQRNISQRTRSSVMLVLARGIQDIIIKKNPGAVLQSQENEIICLFTLNRVSELNSVFISFKELQSSIQANFGLSVSLAIGDTVADSKDIHGSYLSAKRYLTHKFFRGPGSFITPEDFHDNDERYIHYPTHITKPLINNIRLLHATEVQSMLSDFKGLVEGTTYIGALALCDQLINELLLSFSPLEEDNPSLFNSYRRFARDLASIDFLENVMDHIKKLCELIGDCLNEQSGDKKTNLIKQAKEIMFSGYSDPCINLEQIAFKLEISPGYLGRIFHEREGCHINEYLNDLRMKKAEELLIKTNLSTSEISRSIGMQNETYFFTLFKKLIGTTPARYRKKNY